MKLRTLMGLVGLGSRRCRARDESRPAAGELPPVGGIYRWEQDSDFRFTSHEAAKASLVGGIALAKLGRTRWELSGAVPLDSTWDEHRAGLNAWKPFTDFRYVIFLEGNYPRYLSCSGVPVFGEDGGFAGYQGTTRDITAELLAERKERDATAMLKVSASLGRLGAWSLDPRTMDLVWSDEVCRIHELPLGYKCDVARAIEFYAPEYRERIALAVQACIEHGTHFDLELQIISANNRRVWVKAMCEAEKDSRGRVVRLQGAFQEIGALKQAAEDAQLLAQSLAATLDSLTDGFYVLDFEARFRFVNQEACKAFRKPVSELTGRKIWDVFPQALGTPLEQVIQRGLTDRCVVELEDYYEPMETWFRLRACPSPEGLAVSFTDITRLKLAQAELTSANAELEERVAARTAELRMAVREMEMLAYAVAHDLRAPLSAINGFSKMLMHPRAGALSEQGQQFARRISAASVQMDEMTEGLLQLARLSSKELKREFVNLGDIARSVVRTLELDTTRESDIEIDTELWADCDAALLVHVLGNLIGNAWKFSAAQSPARLKVGMLMSGDSEPVYFVKDNGVGFDSNYADRLFKPFHRLHSTSEFKGSGIGLSVAHKIVKLHGGHIWAESAPGEGATFFFTLGTHPAK